MSQHCVLGAEDQPRRGLETGHMRGVAMLGDPTLPSTAHTQPLLSPRRTAELQEPLPAFQTEAAVLVKTRISMEIETSFFRGPLSTSPSHISNPWVVL